MAAQLQHRTPLFAHWLADASGPYRPVLGATGAKALRSRRLRALALYHRSHRGVQPLDSTSNWMKVGATSDATWRTRAKSWWSATASDLKSATCPCRFRLKGSPEIRPYLPKVGAQTVCIATTRLGRGGCPCGSKAVERAAQDCFLRVPARAASSSWQSREIVPLWPQLPIR